MASIMSSSGQTTSALCLAVSPSRRRSAAISRSASRGGRHGLPVTRREEDHAGEGHEAVWRDDAEPRAVGPAAFRDRHLGVRPLLQDALHLHG